MSLRHFLNVADLSAVEIAQVLQLSELPIEQLKRPLAGQGAALIFEKPSNRTRQSMEMAVVQLGGHPIYTRGEEVGLDVRESVEDVTSVMMGYHALLAARVFDHAVVQRMANVSSVPIVNMLSNDSHPLQALADALTMQQEWSTLRGHTVAYIGDYNNVARSLAEICVMLGAHVRLGCPAGYDAAPDELARIDSLGAGTVVQTPDPLDAVAHAHAVHTDTWTSMGQEQQKTQRQEVLSRYQVNPTVMRAAAPDSIFMHCLPAYRGREVAAEVIDGLQSKVYVQSHNRMHAARGLIAFLCGVRP